MAIKFVALLLATCLAGALAQDLTGTYFARLYYSAAGCAAADSNQMKIFQLNTCIPDGGGATATKYSCDGSGNPSATYYDDGTCGTVRVTEPLTPDNCAANGPYFLVSGCINASTIASSFMGSTVAIFSYQSTSTCTANANNWLWATVNSKYCQDSLIADAKSYFYTCDATTTTNYWCQTTTCGDCDYIHVTPTTYSTDCDNSANKKRCLNGIFVPQPPQSPPTPTSQGLAPYSFVFPAPTATGSGVFLSAGSFVALIACICAVLFRM